MNCNCCGHTAKPCECPSKPGDWDPCHKVHPYGCTVCGRQYQVNHSSTVSPVGEPCTGKDCKGTLCARTYGKGNRRY